MKKNKFIKSIIMMLLLGGVFFTAKDSWEAPPSGPALADYTAYPPFVIGSSVKPNVLILFSNDHTNFYRGYSDTLDMDDDGTADTTYKDTIKYYGYFDSNKCYTYSGGTFNPASPATGANNHYCSGNWSGNFLNWATMSHVDFVRKALTGGKRVMDSATKTTILRGDPGTAGSYAVDDAWNKVYSGSDLNQLTPFSGTYTFRNYRTYLYVRSGSYPSITCSAADDWTYPAGGAGCDTTAPSYTYTVEVEVCKSTIAGFVGIAGLEDNCKTYEDVGVTTYKPTGVIIEYADQVRFGLMTYSVDSREDKGGILRRNVQDVVNEINPNGTINSGIADSIIRYINEFSPKGWDPVAEMYYEAIRYYKNTTLSPISPTSTYRCGAGGPTDDSFPMYCNSGSRWWIDPIQNYCQGNYIIIVNDEYPSKDHDDLPSSAYTTGVLPNDSGINTYNLTNSVGSAEGINGTSQSVGATTCTASGTDCTNATTCSSQLINNLGNVVGICPSEPTGEGTFNIAGLAYYAHTQDFRTGNCGGVACTGTQSIKTYAIAYRASPGGYQAPPSPMNQLWLAAKYGGFKDSDGDGLPYTNSTCGTASPNAKCDEWDEINNSTKLTPGDGIPDNYFVAENGSEFKTAFLDVLTDILQRESSGSSASVLATTGEGEGAVYQAYFIPEKIVANKKLSWIGYLHGLFIDKHGNIREDTGLNDTLNYEIDTNGDGTADILGDRIVKMSFDSNANATVVNKYDDLNMNGVADSGELVAGSPFALGDVATIWEAGKVLWDTNPANRVIKTSTQDTCTTSTPCAATLFTTANKTALRPYLRASTDNEAEAIIRYIRGEDTPITIGGTTYTYRNRTFEIGGVSKTWKLGDTVYSTPTTVTKPSENYDFIYSDSTYAAFKSQYKSRRHVVYAGANDGMLHAFNAGFYSTDELKYCDTWSDGNGNSRIDTGECSGSNDLGKELFAFIPQSLLPHLKWLTDTTYTHVYYVDLKPKVVDARIFTADATHPNGWGTVLIGGMRFGGRDITFTDDFDGNGSTEQKTFYSAYFALDITDPEDSASYGKLLWTYTDSTGDLNMTTSYPAVARTGPKNPFSTATGTWHVVFGSGPTSYAGTSTKSGKIYVLNLATGALARKIVNSSVLMNNAFMAEPITIDVDLDYQVDVIYIGNTYCGSGGGCTSSTWRGKMYRISTGENTDPNNWQTPSVLFDPQQPVTSAPVAAMDEKANLWVFFGTGRFLDSTDESLDGTERWGFYGIKDTCKPWKNPTCTTTILKANLFDSSNVDVCLGGTTTTCSGNAQTWSTILASIHNPTNQGWYIDFSTAGERVLSQPVVLGGLTVWTTYIPSTDPCAYEGTSNVYATFYKTGTAYKKYVFEQTGATVMRSESLGVGIPSSVGVMVTGDNKIMGFVQQSTGTIIQIEQITPFTLRSGFIGWKQEAIP